MPIVVVREMQTMLRRLIGEDVAIVLGLVIDPGAHQRRSRASWSRSVLNLAVNARDAMPTGGTLTPETAHVELDENYARTHLAVQSGHYIVLTVTDTGSGMAPEVQARLFERLSLPPRP